MLPYLKLARDRGAVTAQQAEVVESMVGRLDDLVPQEPPARLHGDLWNGNVLWGHDGVVRMVDPAAHAGHRETDLAMLSLFGLPHLQRALDAYEEADAARGRLGGPGRPCTSCSRCSCTPRCSAAGTAPGPPRSPRATERRVTRNRGHRLRGGSGPAGTVGT